jgi:hypothetical protein
MQDKKTATRKSITLEEYKKLQKKKRTKFGNKITTIDGIKFHSQLEGSYYLELKIKKSAGIIKDFSLQPKFLLQPKFTHEGKEIAPITYIGDFLITHNDGSIEVVDTKGAETDVFKMKKKMFHYYHPHLKLSIVRANNDKKLNNGKVKSNATNRPTKRVSRKKQSTRI